jgi:hypothetical protein
MEGNVAKIILGACIVLVLSGCKDRWDFSSELGFVVEDVELSNINLKCGETQHGDTATYHVKCVFSANVKHPAQFIPTGRVLKVTKWQPLSRIQKQEMELLTQAGLYSKGRTQPDNLGLTYSAVFESSITPLFRLDLWSEKSGYVTSHIEAETTIDVSAQKCEIVKVADKKFYFCYDFGSK